MSAPTLEVCEVNQNLTVVRGWFVRDMLTELTGRPPLWLSVSRGWCTTPKTAADLIAATERRGWTVTHLEPEEHAEAHARGVLW
jgi:hypothetical protein